MQTLLLHQGYEAVYSVPHGSGTYYADSTIGGRSTAWNATYTTARSKGGTGDVDVGEYTVGQFEAASVFYLYQIFLAFDLTAIPSKATIATATFSAYPSDVGTTNAYTMNLRLHPWGPALAYAADFVAGDDVAGDTLLAHLASASWTAGAYRAWVDDALAANLTPGAWNYAYVVSSLFEAGTAPGSGVDERLSADPTTNKPKLEVTW